MDLLWWLWGDGRWCGGLGSVGCGGGVVGVDGLGHVNQHGVGDGTLLCQEPDGVAHHGAIPTHNRAHGGRRLVMTQHPVLEGFACEVTPTAVGIGHLGNAPTRSAGLDCVAGHALRELQLPSIRQQ